MPQIQQVRDGLVVVHRGAARERIAKNDGVLIATVEDVAKAPLVVQVNGPALAVVLEIDATRDLRLAEHGILPVALPVALAEHELRAGSARAQIGTRREQQLERDERHY